MPAPILGQPSLDGRSTLLLPVPSAIIKAVLLTMLTEALQSVEALERAAELVTRYTLSGKAWVAIGQGAKPDPATGGVLWKAQLVVAFERNGHGDRLELPASVKQAARRLIDEIVATEDILNC